MARGSVKSTGRRKKPPLYYRAMSEHEHQVEFIKMAKRHYFKYPDLKYLHAVPNGSDRHMLVAIKLKEEGVIKGPFDIFLDAKRGRYSAFRLEIKSPPAISVKTGKPWESTRGRPTPEQRKFEAFYRANGMFAAYAWGWEEAWDITHWYIQGADMRKCPIKLESGYDG